MSNEKLFFNAHVMFVVLSLKENFLGALKSMRIKMGKTIVIIDGRK